MVIRITTESEALMSMQQQKVYAPPFQVYYQNSLPTPVDPENAKTTR
jgi:hypothetical protein